MEKHWPQVWDSLVATPFGLYSSWERRLEESCGLSALHFHVLQTLAEAPEGRLRLQDLAEAVRHSQSGTTRLVDRLEKQDLVARHFCAEDRRVTWALLSAKGQEAYKVALPEWNAFLAGHLKAALSVEEAVTLTTLLGKLRATLDPATPSCPSNGL